MKRSNKGDLAAELGLPRMKLPPSKPLTPKQAERRRRAVERILELRASTGPIDMTIEELLGDD